MDKQPDIYLEVLAFTAPEGASGHRRPVRFEDRDAEVVLLQLYRNNTKLLEVDVTPIYEQSEAGLKILQNLCLVLGAQIDHLISQAYYEGIRRSEGAVELRRALASFLNIPVPGDGV